MFPDGLNRETNGSHPQRLSIFQDLDGFQTVNSRVPDPRALHNLRPLAISIRQVGLWMGVTRPWLRVVVVWSLILFIKYTQLYRIEYLLIVFNIRFPLFH